MQIESETRFDAQGKENMNIIRSLKFEYNYVETAVCVVTVLLQADNDQTSR